MAGAGDAMDEDIGFPRVLSRGRAYVYLVACRDEPLFKIGFSRDPLHRWRALQPRFFEFFDLDQGILVAVDRVNEARRLERMLLEAFADYQAWAPLSVAASAAGHTEWFRGVLAEAVDIATAVATQNAWECHQPREWMRVAWLARRDLLFDWTASMLEASEFEQHNTGGADPSVRRVYERALVDTLDAFSSVGVDIRKHVPAGVRRWYAAQAGTGPSSAGWQE